MICSLIFICFIFNYARVWVWVCTWDQCPQKSQEGVRFPGAGVSGVCELLSMSVGTKPECTWRVIHILSWGPISLASHPFLKWFITQTKWAQKRKGEGQTWKKEGNKEGRKENTFWPLGLGTQLTVMVAAPVGEHMLKCSLVHVSNSLFPLNRAMTLGLIVSELLRRRDRLCYTKPPISGRDVSI